MSDPRVIRPRPLDDSEPADAPWPDTMRAWPPGDAGPAPRRRNSNPGRSAAEALLAEAGWRWSASAGGYVHPDRRGLAVSYTAACREAGIR